MTASGQDSEVSAVSRDVGFAPMNGRHEAQKPSPKSAKARNRCAIARCAGSPTASAVTGGKIVKTQNRCALVRSLRRCGLSANMMVAGKTVHIRAPKSESRHLHVKNFE